MCGATPLSRLQILSTYERNIHIYELNIPISRPHASKLILKFRPHTIKTSKYQHTHPYSISHQHTSKNIQKKKNKIFQLEFTKTFENLNHKLLIVSF